MSLWHDILNLFGNFWHVILSVAAFTYWIIKTDQRSKRNREEIDVHDREIKDIQKSLSKQESRIDQLFDMVRETRDGVNRLLDKMLGK